MQYATANGKHYFDQGYNLMRLAKAIDDCEASFAALGLVLGLLDYLAGRADRRDAQLVLL